MTITNPHGPDGRSLDPDFMLGSVEDEPLLQHLLMLWDGLSDMVESGRLTEDKIPEDYDWLMKMMVNANTLYEAEGEDKDFDGVNHDTL